MLARLFLRQLQIDITDDEYAEVCRRNAFDAAYAGSACASHDFCDANMTMQEAFETGGIVVDLENDEHLSLWSQAWATAKVIMIEEAKGVA